MYSPFQFDRFIHTLSLLRRRMVGPLGLLLLLGCAGYGRAQDAPPGAVGRLEGDDISVDSGTPASIATTGAAPSMFVANGGVITVHSGQARLLLESGGLLDICGPAKLTVLESGGAITIALNFGRVRSELPATTNLRIFTPSIIATPIGIGGAARDIAVGLSLDDSLCVLATSGALELEQQFTGEKLVVPQTGEFLLTGGQLVPVASAPGSCGCAEAPTRNSVAPAPSMARTPVTQVEASDAMLMTPVASTPAVGPSDAAANQTAADKRGVTYSALGNVNETNPDTATAKNSVPDAPSVDAPVFTVVAPLTYSAVDPARPDSSPDMVLLIREARVQPDWEFNGRVEPPEFTKSMEKALGVSTAAPASQAPATAQDPAKEKKKGGFWSGFKKLFGGGAPNPSGE